MTRQYNKFQQIKCKLRSIIPLNDEDILFIKTLTNEEKNELLLLYNEILKYVISYVNVTLSDL